FERHVERRMALELEVHLRQLVSGLGRRTDRSLEVARPPAEARFQEPLSGLYWQIVVEPNGPVLRSRSLWDMTLNLPTDHLADADVHQHTISGPGRSSLLAVERSVALPANLGGARIRAAVAVDRSEIHAAGRAFAADLVPSLALLAAFLVAAAWVQVAVGLRPLDAVRRRLHHVRAGREARLGTAFPDEVRPLAAEVDHLLDAQEAAIARARARAADLAHGLKTPLTILASDAEELRKRGETDIADEIATVTDGMRRHVERELVRARAGMRARVGALQSVRPVLDQVVAVLRRTPRGHPLDWEIAVGDDLAVPVDAQDMAEIIGNLGENAAKWAASRVRVEGRWEGGAVNFSVEDDGPGVPEDQIGTVLARGGRLDEAQPGTGLGLAIVRELTEAYGGSLSLQRSSLGGLSAEVRFPSKAEERAS
ncbi:MAG: sensor histidine kinase, partial [Microvirga sp.]|nr:sensor histidine kinase [Microvirga sp.]